MSQKNIKQFFARSPLSDKKCGNAVAEKRKLEQSEAAAASDEGDGCKKAKEEAAVTGTGSDVVMSPEAKKRAGDNQLVAKIKLKSKQFGGALHPNIGQSWFKHLESEFDKPYFASLNAYLAKERANQTIFPPADQVWSWTRDFDVQETRVVILGQDPYHGPDQAHGLCFSVRKGVRVPPSLVNMYKELAQDEDVPEFSNSPGHGYLQGWAEQGVLLLNACLTVRKGAANSHKDQGWERITDRVIKLVSDECPAGVVFLLWGSHAHKKAAAVDAKKHHLLKTVHPSPLSAHRGFIGCQHFSKCNQLLQKSGRKPIDWAKL